MACIRAALRQPLDRQDICTERPLPEAAARLLQVEYLSEKLLSVGIRVDPETVRSAKDTPSEDAPVPIKPPHVSLPPHQIVCSRQRPREQSAGIRHPEAGAMDKLMGWLEASWSVRASPSKLGRSPVYIQDLSSG